MGDESLIDRIIGDITFIVMVYIIFFIFALLAKYWMKINITSKFIVIAPLCVSVGLLIIIKVINFFKID